MINIVLFEPEIVLNTGNIARICVGFNANLHLIRPYGFIFSKDRFHKDFIRSSANHIDKLNIFEYDDYNDFLNQNKDINNGNIFFFTRYGEHAPDYFDYPDISKNQSVYLVFGKESSGIPYSFLKLFTNNWIRIPTSVNLRSLNVANTVAIAIYEVAKKNNYFSLSLFEPHKQIKKD